MKNFVNQNTIENLINYTNERLKNWYKEVKSSYGVVGSGKCRFSEERIYIDFVEDGVEKTWSMYFHLSYLKTEKKDWVFNCWSSEAGLL